MQKILVSSCLLGENVRYDGKQITSLSPLLQHWQDQQRVIRFCPEVAGGLSVPRSPAERQENGEIITLLGVNVTAAFQRGAQQALQLCLQHDIRFAVLKESSPSCGSQNIYDGSFKNKKISGQGLTTQLLQQHHIEVFSEFTLNKLAERLA
ncbi:MAG: DUF523 domain-containing protein [Alteromonadaceae bacterium]|nr:DUF523 domain-containing protein [Alteromonadaceae bacterium]